MSATTNVNYRTVVHKTSMGITFAFPDVCKTPFPGGSIPIPYPNFSFSADTANGSKTVKCDGNPVMLKDSYFKVSTGDEPGVLGGIFSGVTKGRAEFITYSFDVKFEDRNVCRLLDLMVSNKRNTPPWPEFQPPIFSVLLDMLADFLEAIGEFASAVLDIIETYVVPIVMGIIEGAIDFISDKLIGLIIGVVLVTLVVLTAPVSLATAVIIVTVGTITHSIASSAKTRYQNGQSLVQSVVGGVLDVFDISGIYNSITNSDIMTQEDLGLTTKERAALLTKSVLSLITPIKRKGAKAPSKPRMTKTTSKPKTVPLTVKSPKTKAKIEPTKPDPNIKSDVGQRMGTGKDGRRGSPETQAHLDLVRDRFLEKNPDYTHVAGGRDSETGAMLPEEYLPPIQTGQKNPNGKVSRKGGSYPDLTFEAPDGTRVRINTVDVKKNGEMTRRESVNAARIEDQTGSKIITIPKGAPIDETGSGFFD